MADWDETPAEAGKTSIWKKEISFRRKPKADADPDLPAQPSIWKREISFGRKWKDADPEPAAEETEIVLVDEPAPVPAPVPEPVAAAPEPAAAEPEPASAPAPEPDHSWLTAPLEQVSVAPPEEPESEPAPAAVVELPPLPEPEPELAPAPELEPAAAAIELVEEPPAERVPFYKRELSFGRKPKAPKQKAQKAPKPEQPKRERKPKREKPKQKPGERVPFYKRELSLGRKPKAEQPRREERPAEAKAPKPPRAGLGERLRAAMPSLSSGSAKGMKKVVGLKIGGSQIAAARVVNGASPELVQVAREPLDHGVVVGGELRDPEALAAALREFFRRHRLPKRGVRLGIANSRIGVRTFEIAGIDDERQLANAIRFRAQEVLPIPLDEAVLDWHVLSESVNDEGQTVRRILLVVAYRELVDRYLAACRKAGVVVVGIDLEAFALLRAIAAPHEHVTPTGERSALVAVSVGHDRSTFAVSDGRVCEFTRVLEWGGWAMNVAIARALDLTPSEAEPIKRALSLTDAAVPEGMTAEQAEKAREAARRQLQSFARELVSSLQFYQNQADSLGIREIVLTGGTAHMAGLAAELERLIGVPVRIGDPLNRVSVSKRVKERDQVGSLAVAIGLGIED